MYRNTFVKINLKNLQHNMSIVKKYAGSNTLVLTAVKSDAYGHGIIEISKYLEANDLTDYFGVATIEEAIELRKNGLQKAILLLGVTLPFDNNFKAITDYNIIPTVVDSDFCFQLNKYALLSNKMIKVHLKIDTGMGRIGCATGEALNICKEIDKLENISLEGVFTHFPKADENDKNYTLEQINIFKNITDNIEKNGIKIPIKHAANSAALLSMPSAIFDMVRPGIMCYGYNPTSIENIDLKPIMSFISEITFTKKVKKGTGISYGHNYILKNDSNISTISVGYGDGYHRFLSNKARVLIDGKTYPVAGNICMDQIMIDTGEKYFKPGTKVVLFGENQITADNIAEWSGTIPYEVTCSISKRVHRIYC